MLVISIAVIPVADAADQAIVGMLIVTLAIGILTGALVSSASNALFPDPPPRVTDRRAPAFASPEAARWIALMAAIIVVPVFALALTDPSFYVAAIMKTVAPSEQAGQVDTRVAGSELIGSTLMGALIAAIAWLNLSLHPSLRMLALWVMGAALWTGSGISVSVQRHYGHPSGAMR